MKNVFARWLVVFIAATTFASCIRPYTARYDFLTHNNKNNHDVLT